MNALRRLRCLIMFGLCFRTAIEVRAKWIVATPSVLSDGDQFHMALLTVAAA